jgi:hypothetical protein
MTIHSDWARILHEECPQAFTLSKPPMSPSNKHFYQVGIIDGHLQLMRLDTRMETWECFIRNQFLKPIQEMFAYGCPRVVLCFDDYANVPLYKSMTQKSRSSKFEVKTFAAHEELPAQIPEDPMLYLMNRNFKLKLIDMLCRRIPQLLTLQSPEQQEFILDYKMAVRYQAVEGSRHLIPSPELMRDMEHMGESDVKFVRYVKKYGNALVHAIDGDYMTIALLYYTEHDLQATNKIFIYRQFSVLAEPLAKSCGKRKKPSAAPKPVVAAPKAPVKKCWVDMQLLYICITRAMQQCGYGQAISARTHQPFTDRDAVFTAVFLMLCAGTDFSRNLPLIGPKKIWDYLPDIALPAIQALRGGACVNESMLLNLVVGKMYGIAYSKHHTQQTLVSRRDESQPFFERVLHSLQNSKLSQGTKNRLPSADQTRNTIRNLLWVTKYWMTDNGKVETPVDGEYGFARDQEGKLNFEDLVATRRAS